ncbi:MAG: cadmium-translocating P-type ATPase [Clostridiales bacterium]|nr:cadmium-translocating P-type ATPase [Clostridiales bacterium]
MTKTFKIEGLDCANCARELEEELNKIDGVESATVDFMGGKVILTCEESAVAPALYCCNHFEDAKIIDEQAETESVVGGKKIRIANLCCANCGRELEEELNKLDGVTATVDFMNMTVILRAASREAYERAVYCISHFEDVKIVEDGGKRKSVFRENLADIISVIVSAVFFIPAIVLDFLKLGGAVTYVVYALYGVAFAAAGYIVLWNTVRNVAKGRIFDENFLMTLASVGAVVLGLTTGDGLFEGVAVMLLYRIGELLQSVAVGSSRRSITRLMDLKSETATLIKGDEQVVVSPESLAVGDKILIKAGEKIPVDCRILTGETSLDMKSLNGEAMPRNVKAGDEALSGSVNVSGVVTAEVIREYKNSAVAKILELVENSTAKKAKPEKFISKFAKYYTPAVVVAALLVAGIVPTIVCAVQGAYVWARYSEWIYKALSFLVISCPCALVISVPLAYFGGIGRSAKDGILVKGSTCIDEIAKATIAAFDKTGTLTEGVFAVKSYSSEEALKLAACAEKYSSHPIAAAFGDVETAYVCEGAKEVAGRGVICTVNGKTLLCGNALLLSENGVTFTQSNSASTHVYVALDGTYMGVIEIDDRIKEGAEEAICELKKGGISGAYMLTGDNAERAGEVAKELGLDGVYAGLLPDEKLDKAQALKSRGGLIYAGDGINDAPVMTVADCAVSMGRVGSDAAIEASDIVLVSDNLKLLPKARKIAKGTRRIVVENIVGSLVVKFAIMALSIAIPSFPLIVSIFADVGVMLVAVCNSLRTALIK